MEVPTQRNFAGMNDEDFAAFYGSFRKQAVVLAGGGGSRLQLLVTHTPKCLLPIGNHPMLYFCLKNLESFAFDEVIVTVLESQYESVALYLGSLDVSLLKLRIRLVKLPFTASNEYGTVDCLKYVIEDLEETFYVFPCDVIGIFPIVELTRTHFERSNCVCTFFLVDESSLEKKKPAIWKTQTPSKIDDIYNRMNCWFNEDDKGQVLSSAEVTEFSAGEKMSLSKYQLLRYPRSCLIRGLVNLHIFIFRRSLLPWIFNYSDMLELSSIKFDLLPFLIGHQFSELPLTKNDPPEVLEDAVKSLVDAFDKKLQNVGFDKGEEDEATRTHNEDASTHRMSREEGVQKKRGVPSSLKISYSEALNRPIHEFSIRSYVRRASNDELFLRANTLDNYKLANLKMTEKKLSLSGLKELLAKSAALQDKSVKIPLKKVSNSLFAGELLKSDGSAVVKDSAIGMRFSHGAACRVSGCVLMDDVAIADSVELISCIIGKNVIISSNCKLTDCIVQEGEVVPAGTIGEGENFPADVMFL